MKFPATLVPRTPSNKSTPYALYTAPRMTTGIVRRRFQSLSFYAAVVNGILFLFLAQTTQDDSQISVSTNETTECPQETTQLKLARPITTTADRSAIVLVTSPETQQH